MTGIVLLRRSITSDGLWVAFVAGSLLLAAGCGDSAKMAPTADAGRPDASDDLIRANDVNAGQDAGSDTGNDADDASAFDAPTDADDATAFDAATDTDDATAFDATDAEDGAAGAVPTDAEDGTDFDALTDADDGAASPALTDADSDAPTDAVSATAIDATSDANRETGADAIDSVPVIPVLSGTVYSFAFADTVFAVDAAKGARIVTFSLLGRNILTVPTPAEMNNTGSTFWPSPQSDWSWPPPSQIDPGPYTGSPIGGLLSLTSAPAPTLGLVVTKEFSVDSRAGVVTIQYGLVNHGTAARSAAPWEITRVAAGGLTFFPMGDGVPSKGSQDLLPLKIVDGVAWFAYDATLIPNDQKVFADGHEGWIAHVDGDLLLVKSFTDTPVAQAAPGEAEIEIYTNAAHTYIEVENQGAYTKIAAGAKSVWPVRWFLRKLDPSVSVTVGSAELLQIVRALVL